MNIETTPLGICSCASTNILVFFARSRPRGSFIGQCAGFYLVILTCCKTRASANERAVPRSMCGFLEKMAKWQKQNSKENLFKTAKCVTRYQKPMFFSFLTCLKQQKNKKSKLRFMSILTILSNRSPNLRIGQCAATITPYTHVYAHVDINM